MKNPLKLALIFILFTAIWPMQTHASSTRETVLQLLKDYSPDSYYMIDQYFKMPEVIEKYFNSKKIEIKVPKGDFIYYVKGNSEQEILDSIVIVAHEMCHYYTNNRAYQLFRETKKKMELHESYETYYAGNQGDISVKRSNIFNSQEIAAVIPESLRTFHFKTYISPETDDTASKKIGVYGLLNEFNAYYYGTKAAFDMYPFYRDKMTSNAERWVHYMDSINNSYFAYSEFKFFILKYLLYARQNYPVIYQDIINNHEFCRAYLMVDERYGQLIQDYFTLRNKIFENLRKEGYSVNVGPTSYVITRSEPKFTRLGGDYFFTTYELLQNEIAKPEYQAIVKKLGGLE